MSSRFHWFVLLSLVGLMIVPSNGLGLEKTSAVPRGFEPGGDWRAAGTSSVSYYNICTGWVWNWSGWSPEDRLGVVFNSCGASGDTLNAVSIYVWTGAPSGYSYTGTLDVFDVDANLCPTGAPLYSQPWLPLTGNLEVALGTGVIIPGANVAVAFTLATTPGSPMTLTTDHPAAGPTGPQACGFCYPSTRVNHTFYWGTATTAVCPGSPFYDGVCNSELWWVAKFTCAPTAIEPTSWGSLKALYR